MAPASMPAGTNGTTIDIFGSNFQSATVNWNGNALATTEAVGADGQFSTTHLTTTVPASDLSSPGTAQITVVNSTASGNGTSRPLTFTVGATVQPVATTWVRAMPGISAPNDVVWDSVHGKLYVSVSSSDPTSPNTIIPVDPVAGTTGTPVPAGASANPDLLSISSDSSYLWAGLDGTNSVQRYLLPSLAADISFALPRDAGARPQQAVNLEAARVNPHTVAAVAGHWGWSPPGNGVYVYDDATPRPNDIPGCTTTCPAEIDWIQWGNDDSTLYGNENNTIDSGGIADLAVNASGVSQQSYEGGMDISLGYSQFDPANGRLYSYGAAYDPVAVNLIGSFDLPETGSEACTADSSTNRYYCFIASLENGAITVFELWTFDLNTYALLDRETFGSLEQGASTTSISGVPTHLVRWGTAGLALTTQYVDQYYGNGGLYLIDGAAVNPGAVPDSSRGAAAQAYSWMASIFPQQAAVNSSAVTVTLNGTGFTQTSNACYDCSGLQFWFLPTTYVSPTQLSFTVPAALLAAPGPLPISVFDSVTNLFSTNGLTFTVAPSSGTQLTALNLAGNAMAWDSNTSLLYVGTADVDGVYPNQIVALNAQNGTVVQTLNVGSDPDLLSVSAGGQYLYVGYAESTAMSQIALPGLSGLTTWALTTPGSTARYFSEDLRAAPVDPETTAVTLWWPGPDYPNSAGAVVYDGSTPRPDYAAPGWSGGNTVNSDYETLAWGPNDQKLVSRGDGEQFPPLQLFGLQVDGSGVSFAGASAAVFNAGEIHSDFGTGLIYSDDGNVANPSSLAIVGSYGASGLVVPDSSLNRVFILGQTSAQQNTTSYTIDSFDETAFAPVSSITLPNVQGGPFQMIRWGNSGLAVLTSAGMLYLVEDGGFVSSAAPTAASRAAMGQLVKLRWKPRTVRDMVLAGQHLRGDFRMTFNMLR